jgi:hypothetical protein
VFQAIGGTLVKHDKAANPDLCSLESTFGIRVSIPIWTNSTWNFLLTNLQIRTRIWLGIDLDPALTRECSTYLLRIHFLLQFVLGFARKFTALLAKKGVRFPNPWSCENYILACQIRAVTYSRFSKIEVGSFINAALRAAGALRRAEDARSFFHIFLDAWLPYAVTRGSAFFFSYRAGLSALAFQTCPIRLH